MLSNTLVTNEIKNAAGVEVEFERRLIDGPSTIFKNVAQVTGFPDELAIKHSETGKGLNIVRRSIVSFDLTIEDTVTGATAIVRAYAVTVIPLRITGIDTALKLQLAKLMSFLASTGASTTILYDCTGLGAKTLIDGSI